MNALETQIHSTIKEAIPDATVFIGGDGTDHFEAIVVSDAFKDLMLIKQHQMVMKPLKQAFAESVHALALKTFTPEKWEEVKDNFNV